MIKPIGVLHCAISSTEEAPKNYDISNYTGTITLASEYEAGLSGMKAGDTIVVLFWLHQARRDVLMVYPRGDRTRAKRGVFTTRSPVRPNPIAVSELQLLNLEGTTLTVRGVDVLDNTPVIDIKKRIAG